MTGAWSRRAAALRSSAIRDVLRLTERPDVISLAGGLPAGEALPVDRIREAAEHVLIREGSRALQYAPTEGWAELRACIADRASASWGRRVVPEQVLVTTGSQQGLDLLARVLTDPGDRVAVEDPGYLGAHQALRAAGAELVGVPVDADGLDVDRLHHEAPHGVRLAVTVPDFQNPTGATMPDVRRRRLADMASGEGLVVVEDAPYRLLRFDGSESPPLAAMSDRVVSLGTVSKTLAPGLRVGWVIGPRGLVDWLARAKQATDLQTPTLNQAIVVNVLSDEGWFGAHVTALRATYAQRCDALVGALRAALGGRVVWQEPEGGMFVWCRLSHDDTTARSLLDMAVDEGAAFVPGDAFAVEGADTASFRLSFATEPPARLRLAVARLARALARLEGRDAAA